MTDLPFSPKEPTTGDHGLADANRRRRSEVSSLSREKRDPSGSLVKKYVRALSYWARTVSRARPFDVSEYRTRTGIPRDSNDAEVLSADTGAQFRRRWRSPPPGSRKFCEARVRRP
jgi:hypothetical protein